jgi:hypothetical protein
VDHRNFFSLSSNSVTTDVEPANFKTLLNSFAGRAKWTFSNP